MKSYQTKKVVLLVQNTPVKFLNGLTANDMNAINNAFLNINGRIIATFDQVQINENEFLILIEQPFVEDVLAHLDKYAKVSGSMITKLKKKVYFDLDNSIPVESGDYVIEQKKGKLIVTDRQFESNVTEEEFIQFRALNNIPLHGVDFNDEMLLNVSTTDFVSFTKGCFLGQEPISKVYNRSKPTWRLEVKFAYDCTDDEKQKMTSKVKHPENGQLMGFVFVKNE